MFSSTKKFPNLSEYLQYANRRNERRRRMRAAGSDFLRAAGTMGVIGGLLMVFVYAIMAVPLLAMGFGAFALANRQSRRRQPETPEEALERAGEDAVATVWTSLNHSRLHRDLDAGSSALMEEGAASWRRARAALDSPFWSNPNLPLHYRNIRDQSTAVIDRAMDELLILFRTCLPSVPAKRGVGDYVEEVLEQYVFGRGRPTNLPHQFEPAFEIVEKLQTLAIEVESVTHEVAREPEVAHLGASQGLDICITELRSTRQAEEELRQNLS
jgi:hypothetical protein